MAKPHFPAVFPHQPHNIGDLQTMRLGWGSVFREGLIMEDYQELRDRQTACFERYLKLMASRQARERRDDCAITFDEDPPTDQQTPALTAARIRETVLVEGGADTSFTLPSDGATETGERHDRNGRFIQFAFMKRSFYLDLPSDTLCRHEADVLIQQRHGFFWLRDRRWLWMRHQHWLETVRDHNPLQKEYLNGDERSAAEDMAYVLFTLWKFPVDWQFYYRALRFHPKTKRDWEGTGPVI